MIVVRDSRFNSFKKYKIQNNAKSFAGKKKLHKQINNRF